MIHRSTLLSVAFALFSVAGCAGAAADSPGGAGPGGGLVGSPAPDFKAPTLANGKGKVALHELRGSVVLIDFWGTFCEPCKKSFPKLQGLYAQYADSGLQIVGVSEDEEEDKDKIPAFAKEYGAKFKVAWDADKSVAREYKPETMPTSYVVDKAGVVRFEHAGYHDGEEAEIEKEIKELLAQ